MYKSVFKRLIDLVIAIVGLTLTLPITLVVGIILFISNEGSVFFVQKRPGKGEKIFSILKFKTMNDKKDANGQLLPDSERLTPVGMFVRKTSIDEVPQLVNVLKGEMSIIGPRPLFVKYLGFYTDEEKLRHTVRPGITGLAQVKGRNALNWEERLGYDVQYVKNISFLMDLSIFFSTIHSVFSSKGVEVDPRGALKDLDEHRANT